MVTNTKRRIISFIGQHRQVSAKQIVDYLGFNETVVFRHLKELIADGRIVKAGQVPRVSYSLPVSPQAEIEQVMKWAKAERSPVTSPELYCPTRDVFQARLDSWTQRLIKPRGEIAFIIGAILGEIGNNAYDHNLGQWRDLPGVYFQIDPAAGLALLADRGQGIRATLSRALKTIKNDEDALIKAFTVKASGRAPENRGNGLKFVSAMVQAHKLELKFYSGIAQMYIAAGGIKVSKSLPKIPGVVAILNFSL